MMRYDNISTTTRTEFNEYSSRVTYSGYGYTVVVYPSYGTTVGTVTIQSYPGSYQIKNTILPPKNYRWFDNFRTFKPYIFNECLVKYKQILALIRKYSSKSQIATNKRRNFIKILKTI